jgi:hypothetical protein
MKTKYLLFALTVVLPTFINGQDAKQGLYMPLEFKEAYNNGTRKPDGTVSDKYWQNRSQYNIKATIDPYKKLLRGTADITYYNQSPDTLKNIIFHAYNDYYKLGSVRNRPVSIDKDKSIITKGTECSLD